MHVDALRIADSGGRGTGISRRFADVGSAFVSAEWADIANAVHFLASPKAGFVSGERICVDGGGHV